MAFLARRGGRIYFEVAGEKNSRGWVTLVNGFSRSCSDFRAMSRFLSDSGWCVLSFDNRGVGKSETALDFTRADMIADVLALWDELGCRQSNLLGISMGGVISMGVAIEAPLRVNSLTLVSTASRHDLINVSKNEFERDSESIANDFKRYFSSSFLDKNALFVKAMIRETSRVFSDPNLIQGVKAQREAMLSFNYSNQLGALAMPVMILHGEDDQVIPAASSHEMASLIHQAELHTYAGVGHLLLAEIPKTFYGQVAAFLDRKG